MTDDEKLKAIEEMGINWAIRCPSSAGIKETDECQGIEWYDNGAIKEYCSLCWIKALEEKQ